MSAMPLQVKEGSEQKQDRQHRIVKRKDAQRSPRKKVLCSTSEVVEYPAEFL